jgi:hypothetical protein
VLILAVLLVSALLRFVDLGRPFPSGDHAEVAAVVAFFYPRELRSFVPSYQASTWHLLENPHGVTPVTLALIWTTLVGGVGVHITEFWWNVPFALLGLCIIPLSYRLGRQLGGEPAGVIAALFMAVLPVQVTLSRASGGGSHIVIALLAQIWVVSALLDYYQQPTAATSRRASLALVCAILTDVMLPVLLFMVLAIGVCSVQTDPPTFGMRLRRARRLLFGSPIIRWPLVALAWPIGLLFLQAAGLISYGGLLGRLFGGSSRQPGIRIGEFLQNAALNVGPLSLLLLAGCAIVTVPALLRLERRGLLLVWSAFYLAPFMIFSRPYVFDFYLLGITPLVFNAALVIASWLGSPALVRRLAAGAGMLLLLGLLIGRSFTMIVGVNLGPALGSGQAAGAIFPDSGLKAASWWIRAHTPPDALIFADVPFEPYQLSYYTHRPVLAVTDAEQPEEVYQLLDTAPQPPAFYLVVPGNEALLRAHAHDAPALAATVLVDGRPALLIYGQASGAPEQIEAAQANRRFDEQFGGWQAMFAIGTRQ